jgi:hypothetical protein
MLAPPPFVRGQAVTASLPVRVSDTNGAAVAGATVTVRNVETGLERTQTTDDSGLTTFVGLPPGRYEIEVSARGFNKKLAAADVNVSRSEELSLLMDVGTPETVTISAVDDREDPLEDLPNINRDLTPLLQVIPGAAAANPTALGRIVTDAKGKEQQSQRLDGLDVTPLTELPSGDPALSILDSLAKNNVAINSVKTLTYAGQLSFEPPGGGEPIYDLSRPYGPGTGTLLEGISYRGSDGAAGKWKFQLAEAMRNDALNARNFFEYEGRNPLRRNQFGGKAGGPLGGSASLFLAYDGIRAGAERNVYEAVPADAFCRCGGGPVAPLLGGYLPPGTSIVQGASNDASNFLVARRRVRSSGDGNAWDARLDVAGVARAVTGVNDFVADLFTLRFTRQAAQFLVPDGVTGRAQRQGVVLAHGVARLAFGKGNFSHELKFGINESRSYSLVDLPTTTDPRLAQSLVTVGGSVGVSNLPGNPATVPGAALGGLVRGSGRGFEQTPVSFTAGYSLVASLTQSHLMEAGFEARLIRMDFDRFGGLTYTFPDVTAMRSGTASLVNFLSDLSGPSPFNEGRGPRRAAQEYYLSYFQGRWRRSPRVTLSYGLRYDYFGVPRERDGRAFLIDPDNGTPLSPQVPFYRASKLNFQPRAGVSLQLTDNTFLRGGAGFFSGAPRIGDLLLPIESDRFNTGRTAVAFPTTATEVIRSFVASPETREFQPLSFARDFSTPERVFRWDLMLTHTFKRVNDLNVTYSGNVGRNLPVAGIANRIVGVQNDPDPARPAIVRREFDIVRGGLLSRPFGELQYRTSRGRSSFNGLTIQFRRNNASLKTSEHWLDWQNFKSFSAQYTLSRNVGNVSGAVASNTLDFDGDFGYNASDARHLFSVSTSYRLWDDANGRDRRDIIWGWTVSPTVNMRSGLPLVVRLDRPDVVYVDAAGTVFGSPAAGRQAVINTPGGGSSGGARVPDLVPGVNPFLRSDLQLLNPAAFAIPEPGRFGNLKRGALRGPGSFTVDLALTRVLFNATELAGKYGIAADFKMEVTNIFNRANFSNPVSSLPNVLGTSLAGDRLQPGAPFTRLAAGQTFGVINAAEAGRQIQFSLVFKFNEGF